MNDSTSKHSAVVLNTAIEQYRVSPLSDNEGPTCYTDPFALPEYYHPTYEVSSDCSRFNPNACVAGYRLSEMKHVEDLYSLMPPGDYERNILLAYSTLKFRNKPENIPSRELQFQLEVCFRLKGKGGKTYYYKRKSSENGMVNGKISSALSYWEDVGFLRPRDSGFWQLIGHNAEFFDLDIPEIERYQNIFSEQQAKILRLLARGFSSLDIGRTLKISKHTVDTHRRNMLRKLEVSNTPELILIARDIHLID